MDILFYKLKNKINDVKKTATLTAIGDSYPLTVSGTLKNATSKVNPVIEFAKDITYFNGYNYCYIADFNRYYFVTDVVSVRVGLTSISLRVDVLTSFLTQANMGNLEGFVGRCANSNYYSNEIPDNRVQYKSVHNVVVVNPTGSPSNINCENVTFTFSASNNICISVSSYVISNQTPTLENITVPSPLQTLTGVSVIDAQQFRTKGNTYIYVCDKSQNMTWTIGGQSITRSKMEVFLYTCLVEDDAQSFVNNVLIFPFQVPHNNTDETVYVKNEKISEGGVDLKMYSAKGFNSGFLVLRDFTLTLPTGITSTNYTKYEPYNKCEIYIPFLGWTNISLKDNLDCRLIVYYNVDYSTGKGTVYIYNKTKECLIYQSNVLLGVQIPVNTTNMKENELKDQNYTRSFYAGILSSLGSGAVTSIVSNPIAGGVIAGMGTIKSLIDYMNNENLLLDKASNVTYNADATSGFISGLNVKLKFTQLYVESYNSSTEAQYISHIGRPTNKVLTLSDIAQTGTDTYCEIVDLHTTSENGLYSIEDITYPEVDELQRLCAEGIYI